jgi:hypothetical protein
MRNVHTHLHVDEHLAAANVRLDRGLSIAHWRALVLRLEVFVAVLTRHHRKGAPRVLLLLKARMLVVRMPQGAQAAA